MVGVAERCEIQARSGEEAVEQAGRYRIGLSRDFASAVSRLRLRWAAAASRCGALGGEAGARAWTADAGGAAGIGHGGEGRARGPGARAGSYDVVVRLLSLGQQHPYGHVVAGGPAGGPCGPGG